MPTLKKAPKKQSRKITRESRAKVYTSTQW